MRVLTVIVNAEAITWKRGVRGPSVGDRHGLQLDEAPSVPTADREHVAVVRRPERVVEETLALEQRVLGLELAGDLGPDERTVERSTATGIGRRPAVLPRDSLGRRRPAAPREPPR